VRVGGWGGCSMSARDRILANVRASLQRGVPDETARANYEARFATHTRNTVPARTKEPHAALIERFIAEAQAVGATVARLAGTDDIAAEVASYLRDKNLPARIRVAPALHDVAWGEPAQVEVGYGKAEPSDAATLTRAVAGVAETGTLLLASGPATPTTLNFLPDANLVLLTEADIVGAYEDAWDRLRAPNFLTGGDTPRTVNFITGPSRTADIAQELILGAHGPIHLHILLVR
jgi:L-lactate dehydrogenase complex protein LldG